jgi:2-oxoglutarate dehydrogenase E2 component (dihydrolipoamide succinyltransferase)
MDIIVPQVGESIVEAAIGEWFKKDGDYVEKDELLLELETEKVNVELTAEKSGRLTISVENGETVKIGAVIGSIDENAVKPETEAAAPKAEVETEQPVAEKAPAAQPKKTPSPMNPAVPKIAAERGIDPESLEGSGRDGRILVDDIPTEAPPLAKPTASIEQVTSVKQGQPESAEKSERITRVPMTQIRKKIAAHLLKAKQETAMLTTFNEVDMSRVKELRSRYKDSFLKQHGIGLGFMSFFVKASATALLRYPDVNASIDGNDILYHNYVDIGIAVGSKRGLVVPVIRNADQLGLHHIEQTIRNFADRAQSGKLTLADLEGGTFTITNGGVYGSVLSTPLLNPPQSAILGMHGIQDRAVVRNGEIVIRPIMNIALSYDHRIIDGQQAVGFLKQIKTYIDDPETLLLQL